MHWVSFQGSHGHWKTWKKLKKNSRYGKIMEVYNLGKIMEKSWNFISKARENLNGHSIDYVFYGTPERELRTCSLSLERNVISTWFTICFIFIVKTIFVMP